MANYISSQIILKLEEMQDLVSAMDNLTSISGSIDSQNSFDFCNLHHFFVKRLSAHFSSLDIELRQRVLPLVADIQSAGHRNA